MDSERIFEKLAARPGGSLVSPSFDLPFSEAAAAELAGRAYWIALIAFALIAVIAAVLGFKASLVWGVMAVALAAAAFAVVTVALQLGLNAVVAVFRIASYTGEIVQQEAIIALNTAELGKSSSPATQFAPSCH